MDLRSNFGPLMAGDFVEEGDCILKDVVELGEVSIVGVEGIIQFTGIDQLDDREMQNISLGKR